MLSKALLLAAGINLFARAAGQTCDGSTATPDVFSLQSSLDGSCVDDYADDGQLYTDKSTQTKANQFTLVRQVSGGFQLIDQTVKNGPKFCVGEQATSNQFQCSGDANPSNDQNMFGACNGLLTYKGSSDFYACGPGIFPTLTSYNYFTVQYPNCIPVKFSIVTYDQCFPAPPTSTSVHNYNDELATRDYLNHNDELSSRVNLDDNLNNEFSPRDYFEHNDNDELAPRDYINHNGELSFRVYLDDNFHDEFSSRNHLEHNHNDELTP
ncbi:hypothetical protein BCR37DRAFT_391501 [Protomyces lactucae-debilis]|uniref:Uncharacterized protein n=1 Tax=Protomyces lactucae-debilis TaxID=2754530 RepID=A0A1Y2FP32_PROLT|nr:uncharacterized protein BCR37DRAFT_391501 [Protomyces lactucae-debilis]ORY85741.1 hypothetical protein BCR37DRAFT_391501 [Protomyces lactucae-debilis]